jgi:hypothetical protein
MAREQASGERKRYSQTHYFTSGQRRRGTAEAMRRMNYKLHRSGRFREPDEHGAADSNNAQPG